MKTIKLLTTLMIIAIFIVSCEQENLQDNEAIESSIKTSKVKNQKYRNFNITSDEKTPKKVIALVKKQIDEIYSSDLKKSTIIKMTQVRSIHLIPNVDTRFNDILYESAEKTVYVNDHKGYLNFSKRNKNINLVLHELVHYYDHVHLGGNKNNELLKLYRKARKDKIYPKSSKVLGNKFEYIATSIEAYFSKGKTKRPPFSKKNIQKKDPQLAKFIKANF